MSYLEANLLFPPHFMGLRGGDTIEYLAFAGLSHDAEGNLVKEYVKRRGKVQPLLLSETHVVVNAGGRHGTPVVVNEGNFVRLVRRAR